MICSQCGYENDLDATFCENCGSNLTTLCPECGTSLKPGVGFCKKCGARISKPSRTLENSERLAVLQKAAPAELKEKIRAVSTEIEGERKPVTILFTDIVGSTAHAEKLDPEEWMEIVAGAHRRVSQAIYRYEGTIAQLLGDGVLAFFGAPVTHEDDPLRAVRAALDIQMMITEYERELSGYLEHFQMRIGLNTGTVVVGNLGSDLHMEYLAVGDAVNLAARLQSAAGPGGVLISESTARLVKASIELQPLGEITVKGKAEPVNVYQVLKEKAVPESGRGYVELRSPLVGRDEELAVLHATLMSLANGHGQIVAIIGEAGIGKSRLIEEVRQFPSEVFKNLHWIEGRALSYGQSLSFWIIRQLLFSDLGLSDGDPEARIRAALKKRASELFAERAAEVLPYLLHLSGVRLEGEQAQRISILDGETLKRQILITIRQYFECLARVRPSVAIFEDLHWIDPSSLEALEQLLGVTDHAPLMLLLISRLEREHPAWGIKLKAETEYAHRYNEIQLKGLSGNEQNQLMDNLLAVADFPEGFRRLILERAEGNPFYLEEIVRSLIDQGALLHEGDTWQTAGELQKLSIPDTLQGILLARIDRLQEDVRRTLQLASVIGKSFLFKLLEAIAEAESRLESHLAMLQRMDLVREKAYYPELEYIFKHSMTQEAAYNSLLLERRREFHQRVGLALEQLFAERKEQFLGLLAHHFEAAGDPVKGIDYLIQAGDQARLTDEHSEAIEYYQRALKLLEELSDKSRASQVWLKLALIYHANFDFEASHHAFETAFQLRPSSLAHETGKADREGHTLRISNDNPFVMLDPGKDKWEMDIKVISLIFSGLTQVDEEMAIIPEIAHSWQVLDEGKRYLFHLRNDFTWTDGNPVTAADFVYAWKRNLNPITESETAYLLYDIVGGREYHLGTDADPEHVGVRALDATTLEVRLAEPVAYFPYITSMPVAYPLPRSAIERFGEDWWMPEHSITNGAYRLVAFDPQLGCSIERFTDYPGLVTGNISRIEWTVMMDRDRRLQDYLQDRVDFTYIPETMIPNDLPRQQIKSANELVSYLFLFNPSTPPLDDLRVRKAIAHTVNRKMFYDKFHIPVIQGGFVPPGMPGHSPDIGIPYDIEAGRKLLAEAGFPDGRGFPKLTVIAFPGFVQYLADEFIHQWHEYLGIDISFTEVGSWKLKDWEEKRVCGSMVFTGWLADHPDPDNFFRQNWLILLLQTCGWQDAAAFYRLVEEAARTTHRAKRLALYRQADRWLVQEEVLLLPMSYGGEQDLCLVKPWVKNYKPNLLRIMMCKNFVIENHQGKL